MLYSTREPLSKRTFFDNDQFIGCETGILLKNMPADDVLMFPGCVFEGNRTDIENLVGCGLDLEGAEFR